MDRFRKPKPYKFEKRERYLTDLLHIISGNYSSSYDLTRQLETILYSFSTGKLRKSKEVHIDSEVLSTLISLKGIFNKNLEQSLTFVDFKFSKSVLRQKVQSIVLMLRGEITESEVQILIDP